MIPKSGYRFSEKDHAPQIRQAKPSAERTKSGSEETAMRQLSRRQLVHGLAGGLAGAMLASGRLAFAQGSIAVDDKSVLIVVDVQNCFLPGGSLAVKDGDQVVP